MKHLPADSIKWFWALSLTAFAITGVAGCNSKVQTYPVSGQFKFEDGSVPKFGEVEFFNEEKKINARGKINRDGTFTVSTFKEGDGAVLGKHKIVVMQNLTSPLIARARAEAEVQHDHGRLMSPIYFDYRTSDLECEITEGENRVERVLKLMPKQTTDGLPIKED